MKKLLRELRREFPRATITITRRNHFRVALPNGRVVIVSGTPSVATAFATWSISEELPKASDEAFDRRLRQL